MTRFVTPEGLDARIQSSVNILRLSAAASAATNDAAIAAAIAACPVGGTVQVSPGVFLVSQQITIDKAITLTGYGATLTATASNKHMRFKITAAATVQGFTLDGVAAAGDVRGYNQGTIEVRASVGAKVIDNYIKNSIGMGVYGYGAGKATTVRGNVFDSTFHGVFIESDGVGVPSGWIVSGNTGSNFKGVAVCGIKVKGTPLAGSGRHRITGNSMTGKAAGATNDELGIEMQSGGTTQTGNDHCVVANNYCEGWHMGISIDSSRGTSVAGNNLKANLYAGIELAASMHAAVTGNTCDGYTSAGVLVSKIGIVASNQYAAARTHGHSITGNTIRGASTDGIKVQDCEGFTISANTISPDTGTGINLLQFDHATLTANVLRGNVQKAAIFLDCDTVSAVAISANIFVGTWQKPIDIYFSSNLKTATNISIIGNSLKATFGTGITVTGAGTLTKVTMLGNVGTSSMEGNWVDWVQRLGTIEGVFPPNNNATAGEGSLYLDNYNAGSPKLWFKASGGVGVTGWVEVPRQTTAQADSAAADATALRGDFNALLAKLRAGGMLAP